MGVEYKKISPSVKKVWIIHNIIKSLFLITAVILVNKVFLHSIWPYVGVTILSIFLVFIYPFVEYKQWRYAICEERIEIIHGIFWIERTIIPINRIQHFNIRQGILQKRFDLNSIDIYTAGGINRIVGVLTDEANQIGTYLNQIVYQGDSDGQRQI